MPGFRLLKNGIPGGLVQGCAHTVCDIIHTTSKREESRSWGKEVIDLVRDDLYILDNISIIDELTCNKMTIGAQKYVQNTCRVQ